MGLRQISRTTDEQNALIARFAIAQDTPVSADEHAQQLQVQSDIRSAVLNVANYIDIDIADSREKSLALTHLEEALMWAGKAIFS